MQRRMLVAAAALGLMAGCAAQPPDFSFGGAGFQPDDARLNLAYAGRNLGDMARYRGKPAEAAAALAQFEAAVTGLRNPANNLAIRPVTAEMIMAALRQSRAAVGIPPEVPPAVAAQALGDAVQPLLGGDPAAIRRALSNPAFTLGPEATLGRLTDLPPLRDLESVAPALSAAAGTELPGGVRRR